MLRFAAILVLGFAAGCLGAYSPLAGGGDGGASADLGVDLAAAFSQNVAPIMTASCAGCHAKNGGVGPGFLAPPDMLRTMLAYPGIIGASPETSRIYAKGLHEGPALTPQQAPVVADWINLYNANKPSNGDAGTEKPQLTPFKPVMGANTIELAALDAALVGGTITFDARMIGSSIELSSITVTTPKNSGAHLVHPLWVIWDTHYNPTPDPVDSFSNLDETIPAGQAMPLGPGEVILPNFQAGFMVNVVFQMLEAKQVDNPDGGSVTGGGGCKNLMGFDTSAKPTLGGTCAGCHAQAGNNAQMAFSLLTINQTGGDAQACASTLSEIDTTTPANSRIYTYTDPASGIQHPFKFPAKSNFADAWITTEK
jgi:mono/diheme cytochrome c family protein